MCAEDMKMCRKHFLKGLDFPNAEVASLRIIQVQQTIDKQTKSEMFVVFKRKRKAKKPFPIRISRLLL